MNNEKLIIQIIKDTGLSREEIIEMIEQKKVNLRGRLSELRALQMVGRELAVNTERIKNSRAIHRFRDVF